MIAKRHFTAQLRQYYNPLTNRLLQLVSVGFFVLFISFVSLVYWATGTIKTAHADSSSPTITSLLPNDGPVSAGQTVTVNGTGFYKASQFSDIQQTSKSVCGISAGKVYCWGSNWNGQLGNGDTSGSNQYSPVAVDTSGVLKGKTITQIATSDSGTIVLASDGTAYSWGGNGDGDLGNGDTSGATQYSPVAVDTSGVLKGKTITQIATSDSGTIVLASDGTAYSWGSNWNGQLGNGDTANQYSPVAVDTSGVLKGKTITQIATSGYSTIVLASDGTAYSWGSNWNGQLGNGDTSGAKQYSPVAVDTSGVLKGKTITQIATSGYSTIALASDGTVYGWGYNSYGQLGNGDTSGANQYSPVAVDTSGVLKGKTITQVSAGGYGSIIALASDGTAYSWGYNGNGQLGSGDTSGAKQYSPVAVSGVPVNLSVALGGNSVDVYNETANSFQFITPAHTAGLVDMSLSSDSGSLTLANAYYYVAPPVITNIVPNSGSSAGGDSVTILGNNFNSNDTVTFGNYKATIVNVFDDKTAMTVITPAINSDSAVVDVSITDAFNQQATNSAGFTYMDIPLTAASLNPNKGPASGGQTVAVNGTGFYQKLKLKFSQISQNNDGYSIACGISAGKVYCWGYNSDGELGNGDTSGANQYSPVAVDTSGVLKGKTITQIATSDSGTIALASDGTVYSWGYNGNGQLGSGDTSGAKQYSPVAVDTSGVLKGKTITQIATSGYSTIALASDGTAYSWGSNWNGQLGNGDTANQYSPVAVDTSGVLKGKTITQIATSDSGTIALASDGTAYSWGYNSDGELGNGDTSGANQYSPVAVTPMSASLIDINATLGGNSVTVYNETANSFQFITPEHTPSTVDLTISSPDYGSFTLAKSYTYISSSDNGGNSVISITDITPNTGNNTGGNIAFITGSGLSSGDTVTFGGIPATITGAASDGSSITVIVPATNTTGGVNVVVTNPSGQQATLYNGFIYNGSDIIGNGDSGYTDPSQAITSVNPALPNNSNADSSKRSVIHRRELNDNFSSSPNVNIILPPFVKYILANKATPYVTSGLMLGAIVFMVILLIYQAYKEVKQARYLLAIIKKDRQTVEDKPQKGRRS